MFFLLYLDLFSPAAVQFFFICYLGRFFFLPICLLWRSIGEGGLHHCVSGLGISEVIDPHNSCVPRTSAWTPPVPPCSGPSRLPGASWGLSAWWWDTAKVLSGTHQLRGLHTPCLLLPPYCHYCVLAVVAGTCARWLRFLFVPEPLIPASEQLFLGSAL